MARRQDKYYLNKYMIALYENNAEETCRYVFDNANEFAEFFGIKINAARQALFSLYHGYTHKINCFGEYLLVYFISIDEE